MTYKYGLNPLQFMWATTKMIFLLAVGIFVLCFLKNWAVSTFWPEMIDDISFKKIPIELIILNSFVLGMCFQYYLDRRMEIPK